MWVGSLAARYGWEGWSTWGLFLVTGCLQGFLLAMAVGFEARDWKKRKQGESGVDGDSDTCAGVGETDEDDDQTRLLGNER